VQQVRLAGSVCARRTDRRPWRGLRDAQSTQPSRRTGLQQARLSMGPLRRALHRPDRERAVAVNEWRGPYCLDTSTRRCIPTCCGIRPGLSWPIRAWILGRCNTISATGTSSIRFDIANFLPSGFAISGRIRKRHPKTDGDTAAFYPEPLNWYKMVASCPILK